MSYFLTSSDAKNSRKVLYKGRIVTVLDVSGAVVRIAEDGKWYPHIDFRPLTEDQLREEFIQKMSVLVEGKKISTLKAEGRGVQFVLDDNTRVGLDFASQENLKLSVIDPDGKRIL
jgi:hypothetical protein